MTFRVWLIASVGISAVLPAAGVVVGVAGLEPAISSSQAKRVTSFPTPRDSRARAQDWERNFPTRTERKTNAIKSFANGENLWSEPGQQSFVLSPKGSRTGPPSYRCSTPHDRILPQAIVVEKAGNSEHFRATENQRDRTCFLKWRGPQDVVSERVTHCKHVKVYVMLVIPKWDRRADVNIAVNASRSESAGMLGRFRNPHRTARILSPVGPQVSIHRDLIGTSKPARSMVAQQHGPRNERSGCGALKNSNPPSIDPYYPSANTQKHERQDKHYPAITRRMINRRFRKFHMAQIQSATASTAISKLFVITECLYLRDAQSIGTVTAKSKQSYLSTEVPKWP